MYVPLGYDSSPVFPFVTGAGSISKCGRRQCPDGPRGEGGMDPFLITFLALDIAGACAHALRSVSVDV